MNKSLHLKDMIVTIEINLKEGKGKLVINLMRIMRIQKIVKLMNSKKKIKQIK